MKVLFFGISVILRRLLRRFAPHDALVRADSQNPFPLFKIRLKLGAYGQSMDQNLFLLSLRIYSSGIQTVFILLTDNFDKLCIFLFTCFVRVLVKNLIT